MNAQELIKIAEMRGEFFLAAWYADVKIKSVRKPSVRKVTKRIRVR